MPYSYNRTDHKPLLHETELEISDLPKLVRHVGLLLLGKHLHVEAILANKNSKPSSSTNVMIDRAKKQLFVSTDEERWKRDGWLFQMMTWISMHMERPGIKVIAQAPHTNPAQHGIDGLGIVLTNSNRLEALIIAEDKYTEKPRKTIKEKVWPEFESFEKGEFDSLLVTQTTTLLRDLDEDKINEIIENDIYKTSSRIYRVGITPLAKTNTTSRRKKLFKDYEKCVTGSDQLRRQALTFSQPDIRKWMDHFSNEISDFLDTQRPKKHVQFNN